MGAVHIDYGISVGGAGGDVTSMVSHLAVT